jgi:hypothetical protein
MVFRNVLSEFSWKRWQHTGLLVVGLANRRLHNIGLIPQAKGPMSPRFVQSVEEFFSQTCFAAVPFWFFLGGGGGMDLQSGNFRHVLQIKCSRSCVDQKFRFASLIERNSLVTNEVYCVPHLVLELQF